MVGDFVGSTFEVNNSPIFMPWCSYLILEGLPNIHGLCPSIVDTVLMSFFLQVTVILCQPTSNLSSVLQALLV